MLSHRNLAANAESIIQAIDPRPKDRILGILPLFHSFGYTVTMWVPLQVGASVVYHADPRQSREIGELCRTHHCTLFLATPTFLRMCMRRCDVHDFDTLRFLWCGAEKLSPALAKEFDMVRMDNDGFITITGRLSRFSKIGGEMVPHQRIEDEIHAVLGTSDRVCVVTAVPDESKGERLVVLHAKVDVKTVCKGLGERGLPNLWLPRERDFLALDELPMLRSGKADLKQCKEIALARCGKE